MYTNPGGLCTLNLRSAPSLASYGYNCLPTRCESKLPGAARSRNTRNCNRWSRRFSELLSDGLRDLYPSSRILFVPRRYATEVRSRRLAHLFLSAGGATQRVPKHLEPCQALSRTSKSTKTRQNALGSHRTRRTGSGGVWSRPRRGVHRLPTGKRRGHNNEANPDGGLLNVGEAGRGILPGVVARCPTAGQQLRLGCTHDAA